jgi:hypothetical protein
LEARGDCRRLAGVSFLGEGDDKTTAECLLVSSSALKDGDVNTASARTRGDVRVFRKSRDPSPAGCLSVSVCRRLAGSFGIGVEARGEVEAVECLLTGSLLGDGCLSVSVCRRLAGSFGTGVAARGEVEAVECLLTGSLLGDDCLSLSVCRLREGSFGRGVEARGEVEAVERLLTGSFLGEGCLSVSVCRRLAGS